MRKDTVFLHLSAEKRNQGSIGAMVRIGNGTRPASPNFFPAHVLVRPLCAGQTLPELYAYPYDD
jgi:hypothetical protein